MEKLEATKDHLALVKSTLKLVERVIPPLRRILRSAERARPTLQETLVTLSAQKSFHLLPDEVLSMIFEHTARESPSEAAYLTYVSRRFRDISLRVPALWTNLSSHGPLNDSRARVRLSGNHSVKMNICAHEGNPVHHEHAFAHFNFAVSLSRQLRALDINVRLATDGAFFMRFLASYPVLILPTLDTLCFSCTGIANNECMAMLVDAKPFLSWEMPSLRAIQMLNFVPTFSPEVHSQITSCSIGYGDPPFRNLYWILENALSFLATLPQLAELSIHMVQCLLCPPQSDFKLLLPKLTKLTIDSNVHDVNYLVALSLAIHAPNCKSYHLNLVLGPDDQHQCWILAALGVCKERLPNVEKFDLVVKKRYTFVRPLINMVLGEFPRLQSLGIEGIDFNYSSSNAFFPPLRNIRLKNVKNIEHSFFFDLVENSRGQHDGLESLESVVFDECKEVELDEIQELITKERVIWIE